MNAIRLGTPAVRRNRLRIPVSADGLPGRFLDGDLTVEYDRPVEDVPTSMLTIPAVGNLAPLAWASDSKLVVPELDQRFADAVGDVRRAFNLLYPDLESDPVLDAGDVADAGATGDDSMLLFSGGVDSLASYVRHREESPILMSVHGADVSVENDEGWEEVHRSLARFAEREATELVTVRSTFRSMLEYPLINSHYRESISGEWWSGVQHGLALLAHCAPVAYEMGVSTVYIAATHTDTFSPPWGSCPQIDDAVSWAGTEAVHDGYEWSRQDKIRAIAQFADETGTEPTIRSCYESETGRNCSRCEKCCRTIVGLEIAGLDPTDHGYRVDEETFRHVRTLLEDGRWYIGEDEEYMWRDLQRALPCVDPPHETSREFFEWFRRQEPTALRRNSRDSTGVVEAVEPYLKHVPDPGYEFLKYGKRWLLG